MAKKVFNMQGGLHSAAALSAFLDAAFTGDVAKGLNVTETGTTGLKVLVQPGTGQIHTGQAFSRIIQVDIAEEVTLSAASPSNPRNDLIVAYIDNAVTTTTGVVDNINDVLKFAAVAGTPAGSPTDPSGATIQSAIGAGNPYIVLGRVRVAQSATSLTNSNIDDLRSLVIISNSNQLSNGIIVTDKIVDKAVTVAKTDYLSSPSTTNSCALINSATVTGGTDIIPLNIASFPVGSKIKIEATGYTNDDTVTGINLRVKYNGNLSQNNWSDRSAINKATHQSVVALITKVSGQDTAYINVASSSNIASVNEIYFNAVATLE